MIWYLGKDHTTSIQEREAFIRESATYRIGPHVYIQTCNRVAVYGGEGEFTRELLIQLCRVTSGLDSHMVGEKHIQGQVKKAYLEAIAAGQIRRGCTGCFRLRFALVNWFGHKPAYR